MMEGLSPDIGRWALAAALVLSVAQTAAGGLGRLQTAQRTAYLSAGLVGLAMLTLIAAFLASDFSVSNVAANSHTLKPLLYKIAAAWGNHEGSMVLWCLVLGGFTAILASKSGLSGLLTARALAVMGALSAAFLAFTLFASNPFDRVPNPPWEGRGFNALLQDPAVALHPPMLYLGYVGLAAPFALAIAGLWSGLGRVGGADRAVWARAMRLWSLAAFATLTAGIGLGSYWAYYELGWGGWWFWDPVENASLMPWLLTAALFHSALVTERRGLVTGWTALLAILAFSLAIFGTFLTRSGLLTSVHAFALDPERGALLLVILGATLGPALTLFALRAGALGAPGAPPKLLSREGLLVLNNVFLASSAAVVLIGTLWPIVVEAAGGPVITVGPPYFNAAALPVAAGAFVFTPLAVFAVWGRGWPEVQATLGPWRWALALGLLSAVILGVAAVLVGADWGPALTGAVGVWLMLGGVLQALRALQPADDAGPAHRVRDAWARLRLRPALLASPIAHAGLGLFALGAAAGAAYPFERSAVLKPGEALSWEGGAATLETVQRIDGPNYNAERARIIVTEDGRTSGVFTPERRIYTASDATTSEVAIQARLGGDLYLALGPPQQMADGDIAWTVRVMKNPLIWMVFWGAAAIALSSALAVWGLAVARIPRRGASATSSGEAPASVVDGPVPTPAE